jgi:hypothetical protein
MKRMVFGVMLLAAAAQAQTRDWARLQGTHRGATIVVETGVNAYGPATFDRCRLIRVDASTLTCTMLSNRKRVTFPAAGIDAVYQVKQPWLPGVLELSVVGIFLGGILSGNPPAIAIGLVGGFIWFMAASISSAQHTVDVWTGARPDPLPDDEKRILLYTR